MFLMTQNQSLNQNLSRNLSPSRNRNRRSRVTKLPLANQAASSVGGNARLKPNPLFLSKQTHLPASPPKWLLPSLGQHSQTPSDYNLSDNLSAGTSVKPHLKTQSASNSLRSLCTSPHRRLRDLYLGASARTMRGQVMTPRILGVRLRFLLRQFRLNRIALELSRRHKPSFGVNVKKILTQRTQGLRLRFHPHPFPLNRIALELSRRHKRSFGVNVKKKQTQRTQRIQTTQEVLLRFHPHPFRRHPTALDSSHQQQQ
jgi:hypothetical protein